MLMSKQNNNKYSFNNMLNDYNNKARELGREKRSLHNTLRKEDDEGDKDVKKM